MTSPQHPLTVGSRFGPYRLERLIGRGGMGEVYEAYDTVKDRVVAIKVLPERLAQDPVYRKRFQRESRTAARLREAHVIPIHDYGEIEGRLYIDMRLVDGESLRELLHHSGPGSPERTVTLIEQVAAALDAAHADGLLHRDVKPDNILLTKGGFAYLVDFGIAQSSTDVSLTSTGNAVGSFRYMAPERFTVRDLTPAADVYALACVLFECLTGTRPFSGETDAQIMKAHLFDPVPRPSLVRSTVPASFDPVIARGMAKVPEQRYPSAGELAAAARAALTGAPPGPGTWTGHATDGSGARPLAVESAPAATTSVQPDPAAAPPDSLLDVPTAASAATVLTGPVAPAALTAPTARVRQVPAGNGPSAGPHAGQREPDSSLSVPDGAGSSAPNGPGGSPGPGRGRPRRLTAMLGVIVLVCAAVGFAGWGWSQQTKTGVASGDGTALRGADIDLLALTSGTGYKRWNCWHEQSDADTVAIFSCTANAASSAPRARFLRYSSVAAMQESYKIAVLAGLHPAACPGDPAGVDAPSSVDGKVVGRRTCFDNTAVSPNNPEPSLVFTNETVSAMAVYFWDKDQKALRDYRAKNDQGQFRTPEAAQDPDVFTDADRYVLEHAGDDYSTRNCRHSDVPAGPANAVVTCGTELGRPVKTWFGFPDRAAADSLYQADLAQFPGHACGGTGPDDVWRKKSGPIGRFFCYTDTTSTPPATCLIALHDGLRLLAHLCTMPADHPEHGPATEDELLAYFKKAFG
ncbi:protein kinase [Nocardia yamanashiensis]|uniref:serine/threonine-protein kinase n=1 Tax=Nocardia yamanashiensis TaxID=209247 RepID=UPI001E515640|nr:serine/threonine-protein kinase [Nocardia yamanashiensis]UGT41605.1 protein kinase [Nocardia yamanashiensis]